MLNETVNTVKKNNVKGLARTLQVTICTSWFTPYHIETIENKLLLVDDYNDFDMSRVIVKTPIDHKYYYDAIKKIYSIAFHPRFVLRQLLFLFKFRKEIGNFSLLIVRQLEE